MHIELNSPISAVLFFCGATLIFALLPLTIFLRVRSIYKEWKQDTHNWENSATYRFISNPDRKLSVRIISGMMLLFSTILFLGIVGLIIYISITSRSRGWIVMLIFFVPLLAGAVFAVFALFYVNKLREEN